MMGSRYEFLRDEDTKGLPTELLNQLSKAPDSEILIVHALERLAGTASLDHIIIELYRVTGVIHQRSALTARIYRMKKKGLIQKVKGKKAVYKLTTHNTEGD